jgi:large subunit ribosomal protein L34
MHVKIRKSSIKRTKRGFRYRMKTRGGRAVIRRRRRLGRKLPGFKKLRKYGG